MGEFTLGVEPDRVTVLLSGGADFYQVISAPAEAPYPDGLQVSLEFDTTPATTWTATVTGTAVTWNVDQVLVDALAALGPESVRLWYVDGESRLLWAKGQVVIR